MEIREFEKIVDEAVEALPEKFKEAMDNVEIVVEEWPSADIAKGHLLLGLYQGVPKTVWGRSQGQQIPDKISIYKGPIEYLGRGNPNIIKVFIIDTVKHEIAHHFGISDKRIDEIKRNTKR